MFHRCRENRVPTFSNLATKIMGILIPTVFFCFKQFWHVGVCIQNECERSRQVVFHNLEHVVARDA